MPVAQAAVGLQQAQGDFLTQQLLQFKVRIARQAVYLEAKQFADRFPAREAFDHQGGLGKGRLDVEETGVLGNVRGEELAQ